MKLQLSKNDNHVFITPPVIFYCNVNGRDITAQLTAIIDNPLYFTYRVLFNDGFEDDFSVLENGFIEGTKDGAKGYAFAIKDDLHALHGFDPDKEIYTMRWLISGKHTNIWIKESETEGEKIYNVFFNGDYRFEMKRSGIGLLSRTKRIEETEIINEKLAAEIGRMVDREHHRN